MYMNKTKRLLSFVLVLVMVLSMAPAQVFADAVATSASHTGIGFDNPNTKLETNQVLKTAPVTVEAWINISESYKTDRAGIIWGNYEADANPYISFEVVKGDNIGYPKLVFAKNRHVYDM